MRKALFLLLITPLITFGQTKPDRSVTVDGLRFLRQNVLVGAWETSLPTIAFDTVFNVFATSRPGTGFVSHFVENPVIADVVFANNGISQVSSVAYQDRMSDGDIWDTFEWDGSGDPPTDVYQGDFVWGSSNGAIPRLVIPRDGVIDQPLHAITKAYADANYSGGSGDLWSDPVDAPITYSADNTYDFGTLAVRPRNIYARTFGGYFEALNGSNANAMSIGSVGLSTIGALFALEPPGDPANSLNWNGTEWRIGQTAIGSGGGGFANPATEDLDMNSNDIVGVGRIGYDGTDNSTFAGYQAGNSDDGTTNRNAFFGYQAGLDNTSGNNNLYLGYQSGFNGTTAFQNVSVGSQSLYFNTHGDYNMALGANALQDNLGDRNTAVGFQALYRLADVSADNNVGVGEQAGAFLSDGTTNVTSLSNSIYIGSDSHASAATGITNEIVIGDSATGNGSNTVTIGNSSVTDNYLSGNLNLETGNLDMNSNDIVGVTDITNTEGITINVDSDNDDSSVFQINDGINSVMVANASMVTLPDITIAEINAAGDKAIATKEFVETFSFGTVWAPTDIGAIDKTLVSGDYWKDNFTDDTIELTIDNSASVGDEIRLGTTTNDNYITATPDTGVTFYGKGVDVITGQAYIDSTYVGHIKKMADNLFRLSGPWKTGTPPNQSLIVASADIPELILYVTAQEVDAEADGASVNLTDQTGNVATIVSDNLVVEKTGTAQTAVEGYMDFGTDTDIRLGPSNDCTYCMYLAGQANGTFVAIRDANVTGAASTEFGSYWSGTNIFLRMWGNDGGSTETIGATTDQSLYCVTFDASANEVEHFLDGSLVATQTGVTGSIEQPADPFVINAELDNGAYLFQNTNAWYVFLMMSKELTAGEMTSIKADLDAQ